MSLVRRMTVGMVLALMLVASLAVRATPVTYAQERLCFDVYGITDCIEGRFLEYWRSNGGLPVFGYPISPAREEMTANGTYVTQYFERNRFEYHPENQRPFDVLLGRLGVDRLVQQGRAWESFPKGTAAAGCEFYAETGHTLCGAFKAYWTSHGLDLGQPGYAFGESLALFGFPISEPMVETNAAGDTVLTQHFERGRFEDHGSKGVLLGLLGKETRTAPPPPPPPPPPTDPCAGTPDPVSARIRPSKCERIGTVFFVDIFGFRPNELVGLTLIDPDGSTVDIIIGQVDRNGAVNNLEFDSNEFDVGLWTISVEGFSSDHLAVVNINILDANGNPRRPQECTGTVPPAQNGSITPTCARGTTAVTITGQGFQPGEEIGYYATEPDQSVFDLGPILDEKIFADDQGNIHLELVINGGVLAPGIYAITFEGSQSGHKTIVYFEGADK